MEKIEILSEQVLRTFGPFQLVRCYLKGVYPERGVVSKGLSGFETIEEKEMFRPKVFYEVK